MGDYAAQKEKLKSLFDKAMEKDGTESSANSTIPMPRIAKVKNKQPAAVQITAEQIIREAKDKQEQSFEQPRQKIASAEELADYQLEKRAEFENGIRKARFSSGIWIRYAQFEESQFEFERARSVWERALEVHSRNQAIWIRYAEMEMKHRNLNRARNVLDRSVGLLPRVDTLWYKYTFMEEMLGNIGGCRQVFDRWMQWEPEEQAWLTYANFELRYKEFDLARKVYQNYVSVHPSVQSWLKYAEFEQRHGTTDTTREVFEAAVEQLEEHTRDEELFLAFAKFETSVKEYERARAIFKFSLDHIPRGQATKLYKAFVAFEKQHGDKDGVEEVIVAKRRFEYEEKVRDDPLDYDVWFDYLRLEESEGDISRAREVYERAVSNVPPSTEKRGWRRYIYLWIKYALFEEIDAQNVDRAREVLSVALERIPHKHFTFSKIWIMAAQLEVRAKQLSQARKIMGKSIGVCPKEKTFKEYIELELQLGNVDRVRIIYSKYLEWNPENCAAWARFAEFELALGEVERCRSIYELGVQQPALDLPEVLWKAYIDFEISQGEIERTRLLFERLLDRTSHVKVYLTFAKFEAEHGSTQTTRDIFSRADAHYKGNPDGREERALLLEAWLEFEKSTDGGEVVKLSKMQPQRIKKKRPIIGDDGLETGWEEYVDYVFPDEGGGLANLKLLEAARAWKRQKTSSE